MASEFPTTSSHDGSASDDRGAHDELCDREACPRCGYLLRGLDRDGICPECGTWYSRYEIARYARSPEFPAVFWRFCWPLVIFAVPVLGIPVLELISPDDALFGWVICLFFILWPVSIVALIVNTITQIMLYMQEYVPPYRRTWAPWDAAEALGAPVVLMLCIVLATPFLLYGALAMLL